MNIIFEINNNLMIIINFNNVLKMMMNLNIWMMMFNFRNIWHFQSYDWIMSLIYNRRRIVRGQIVRRRIDRTPYSKSKNFFQHFFQTEKCYSNFHSSSPIKLVFFWYSIASWMDISFLDILSQDISPNRQFVPGFSFTMNITCELKCIQF